MRKRDELGPQFPLRVVKQEAFCKQVALHDIDATEAYTLVYDQQDKTRAQRSSSRLLHKDAVKDRIEWLSTNRSQREIEVVVENQYANQEWVKKELVSQYYGSVAADDRTNALRALNMIGTDLGMFVQRREVLTGKIDPLQESPDVLKRRIAASISLLFPGSSIPGVDGSEGTGRALPDPRESEGQQVVDIPALPEATGISRDGEREEISVPDGSQPSGENILRGDGDELSLAGDLPRFLERTPVPSGSSSLGGRSELGTREGQSSEDPVRPAG